MLLAIDIGNTNITIGAWDGTAWQRHWRILTVRDRTADEYGIALMALLREAGLTDSIDAAVMSSVVPVLTATFSDAVGRYLGQNIIHVTASSDTGIEIGVDNPERIGTDRIGNAVAAYHFRPGPSITLDMGTATKFDVVTADGVLMGGVIAPGLQLTADALVSRAAQLNQVELKAPPQTIGRNTSHAMQAGLIFGYVCLIEGMVARLLAEHPDHGQAIPVLGTGGQINLVAPYTDVIDHVDPWLTLSGLRLIHDRATR